VVAEATRIEGSRDAEYARQHGFAFRFDWGDDGLRCLAPVADVVVIVDVLRFTTAVSAAIEAGATVQPSPWSGRDASWSLSPGDMLGVEAGTRIVLASPNGGELAIAARRHGSRHVLAGALRNASATARRALELSGANGVVAVVAAGERWHDDLVEDASRHEFSAHRPVRPAVEDLLGAGAVLAALDPSGAAGPPACSPEAAAARAAFVAARPLLHDALLQCASGRELIERGLAEDVLAAAALDISEYAAIFVGDEFVRA
jgi:2-phosphosulfolactate phosphatase